MEASFVGSEKLMDLLDMPIDERRRLIAYVREAGRPFAEVVRACTMTVVDAAISTARQTKIDIDARERWTPRQPTKGSP